MKIDRHNVQVKFSLSFLGFGIFISVGWDESSLLLAVEIITSLSSSLCCCGLMRATTRIAITSYW